MYICNKEYRIPEYIIDVYTISKISVYRNRILCICTYDTLYYIYIDIHICTLRIVYTWKT